MFCFFDRNQEMGAGKSSTVRVRVTGITEMLIPRPAQIGAR
jgi:hypothetical protein